MNPFSDVPCLGHTDIFFPEDHKTDWDACRQFCKNCPAKDLCRDEGLEVYRQWRDVKFNLGMYGGLTPDELRGLIGERVKACEICGDWFTPARRIEKYCGRECGLRAHQERKRLSRLKAS